MKAEHTRKAIHILIATSEFPLPEFGARKVDEELKELERLAEIGRATEKYVDVIDNCICDNCSSTVKKGWIYCAYCASKLLWED